MKWVYLVLATAVLPLAGVQLYAASGTALGWWSADPAVYRQSLVWGVGLLALSVAGYARAAWLFRGRKGAAGFPVVRGDGRDLPS